MSLYRLHDETHCPGCGRAGVVVAIDGATLLEVRPEVRRHACGIGGPGSTPAPEPPAPFHWCCPTRKGEAHTPACDKRTGRT